MNDAACIVLASVSPRRHALLQQLGVNFDTLDARVDEARMPGEPPDHYAERLARAKALAGWRLAGGERPALGADTIVVLQGQVLLKPVDEADAARMLSALSGRRHEVLSAVAVALGPDRVDSLINRTGVEFEELPDAWIAAYCAGGEPMDKAGAYAIQGLAARYIRHSDGSFSGVMGLPLCETAQLLERAGVLQ
jgi:septum formation protein